MLAWLVLSSLALPSAASTPHQQASASREASLLIHAQRVVVRPGEELTEVSILIENGRIVAVGPGLSAPEGVRVIEAQEVCAAFLNPWTSLGIDAGSARDIGTQPSTLTADAIDVHGQEDLRRDALRGGVTCVRAQAGMQAETGGFGTVLRLGFDEGPDVILLEDACMAASVGITRRGRALDVFDRVADVDKLIGRLQAGRRYREDQLEYGDDLKEWKEEIAKKVEELEKDFKKAVKDRDKKVKEAEEKGKEFKEKNYKEDKKPKKPKYDPDDEAMARAYHGEVPLVVEVHRAAEIRRLLDETKDMNRLRLVLAGATEAAPFAEELAERDVPVIVWPAPRGEGGPGEYENHELSLAGQLSEEGVTVLIGTGGEPASRDLRLLAALAVGHGMDREEALAAITSNPAQVFDLRSTLGTVERGKDADLLLLDGDPLSSTTRIQYVVSKGRVVIEP